MKRQASCNPFTGNSGNWYSWLAATMGGNKSSGNELNSICPKGWMLITNASNDKTSYYHLIRTAYSISDSSDSKIRPLPLSFIRSGNYSQGSLDNRANLGRYWSSTAFNSSIAYILYFSSGYLNLQNGSYSKRNGYSVRCVVK